MIDFHSDLIYSDEVIDDCLRNGDFLKNIVDIFDLMRRVVPTDAFYIDYIKVLSLVIAIVRRFAASSVHRGQTI